MFVDFKVLYVTADLSFRDAINLIRNEGVKILLTSENHRVVNVQNLTDEAVSSLSEYGIVLASTGFQEEVVENISTNSGSLLKEEEIINSYPRKGTFDIFSKIPKYANNFKPNIDYIEVDEPENFIIALNEVLLGNLGTIDPIRYYLVEVSHPVLGSVCCKFQYIGSSFKNIEEINFPPLLGAKYSVTVSTLKLKFLNGPFRDRFTYLSIGMPFIVSEVSTVRFYDGNISLSTFST